MNTDQVPNGWTRVRFGDVVRKVSTRVDPESSGIERYVAGEHMDSDELTIRRWGEVGDGYLGPAFHMRFTPGQVLYGSRRTYLRKVAVADFEGICANTTFVLESNSKDLLPEFLPLVMTTEDFHGHSIKQSKGSVNPYINFSDLTWYEFALPPVGEQERIVALLRAIDSLQKGVEDALGRAEALHGATVESSTAQLEPSAWRILGEVCDRVTDGPFGSKIKSTHYRPEGARVVRLQNIGIGEFLDKDEAFIGLDYYEELKRSYGFEMGDIVVAGLGDEANPLGRAATIPEAALPAINKADCFLVRPGPDLLSEYLVLALNSRKVLSAVAAQARGTTRSRVSSGAYKQVSVPVPDPVTQREVVARVAEVSRLRSALVRELEDLRQLRRSTLNAEVCPHVQ